MKIYKTLLVALLMMCASGAYAQEQKYFKGALVKNESGKEYFITGNIMNLPVDIVEKAMDNKVEGLTALWQGRGEIKDGKILWVDEAKDIVSKISLGDKAQRDAVYYAPLESTAPGDGIKALKSFLDGPGAAIKSKYFTSSTEYIAYNEPNKHTTEELTTMDSFSDKLLGDMTSLYTDISDLVAYYKNDVKKTELLNDMQLAAKEALSVYKSAILIDPSLNSAAYKELKPYLEKIANKKIPIKDYATYADWGWECNRLLMALGTDINKTYESVLDEALVADNYYTEEYPLKEIYNDLKNIKPTDAKALLGEGGFLTIALNAAIAELTDEPKPDVETCLKITDLSVTIIILLHNAGVDIESAEKLRATLHDKINAYNKMTRNKIGAEIYLNKILEKGTLGYEDLYNLFLNTDYGVAASMIREYNKDTKNPVNAIKVLVVEKLRRRFESMSNEAGVSDLISSQIIKCDLFKTDSKDYKAWESVVNDIKEKDLKPRTAEEKEQLDEYKEDLKLIYEFKVKQ